LPLKIDLTVYLLPLSSRTSSDEPHVLTSGNQGACSAPVFSRSNAGPGSPGGKGVGKVAWLEMREDGYEADRNRVMIYDFEEEKRYGITEEWDRSPTSLKWSDEGDKLWALVAVSSSFSCFLVID
jgi:hypothetical protein